MSKPLILWGGVDINPQRYNQAPLPQTQAPSNHRDEEEFSLVQYAIRMGKPIIGICRGAQLLCIANGGTLYQHSKPHKQDHSIRCRSIDGDTPSVLFDTVSAGHHQIMRPSDNYLVYGWNPNDVFVWDEQNICSVKVNTPEVVWFPAIKGLAIQPHPEWMSSEHPFNVWLNKLVKELEIDYEF